MPTTRISFEDNLIKIRGVICREIVQEELKINDGGGPEPSKEQTIRDRKK